jgi:hypothetical protein
MCPDVYDPPHNIWIFFIPLHATCKNHRPEIRTYLVFDSTSGNFSYKF